MKEAASANLQFYTAVELSVMLPLLLFSFFRKKGLQGGNKIVEDRRRGGRRGDKTVTEEEETKQWKKERRKNLLKKNRGEEWKQDSKGEKEGKIVVEDPRNLN